MMLSLYRMVIGPDMTDRVLALDTLYINTVALIVLIGIDMNNSAYFESALLIAIMGFVGTVALSKYMLRGNIIE
jgi:multicomponent K+:H+ antiporter subunit F